MKGYQWLYFLFVIFTVSCTKDRSNDKDDRLVNPVKNSLLLFEEDYQGSSNSKLYYANLDGSDKKLIVSSTNEITTGAKWSVDGKSFVCYHSSSVQQFTDVNGIVSNGGIFSCSADGQIKMLIANGTNPIYTSDGKYIIYSQLLFDGQQARQLQELCIANSDGTNIKKLTDMSAITKNSYYLTANNCSSNGKSIYFDYFELSNNQYYSIYKVDIDGSNLKRLKYCGDTITRDVNISHDGSFILYTQIVGKKTGNVFSGNIEIFKANADGANPQKLTNFLPDSSQTGGINITPDDKQIYFHQSYHSNVVKDIGIYKMNIDGSGLTQLLKGYYTQPQVY